MIELPRSDAPLASIVISVSSSPELLLSCLRSIERHGPKDLPFETIVVLNAPTGADEDMLRTTVAGVAFIHSPINLGFAGASNLGRAAARGEYIVILHDDAEIEPGWLEALVASAQSHPGAGAIGSKILFPDGRLQNAGMILWADSSTSPPWAGEAPAPDAFSVARAVDYCGSSSLLVRSAAWDAVGGFDERFFPVYYVDVDLSMSVRRCGFAVLFEPASTVRHARGMSSGPLLKAFASARNSRLFVEKWGAELGDHQVRDTRDMAGSIARAIEAAGQRATSLVASTAPCREPFDAERQARHHLERSGAFYRDFTAFVEGSGRRARQSFDRAIPIYALGTELSFARGGNAYPWLVAEGFHPPEAWGVWIKSAVRLMLPLRSHDAARCGLRLEMTASNLLTQMRPRSVSRVKLAGKVVLAIEEDRRGPQAYDIDLAPGDDLPSDCLVLDIECDNVCSPASLGLGSDKRECGLGLRSLRVSALAGTP